MKRIVSIMMASAMMALALSTGLAAMAETYTGTTDSLTKTISGNVVTDTQKLSRVYSVDFQWDTASAFTYTKKQKEVWNTSRHGIETVGVEGGSWDIEEIGFTVTNNSELGIKVNSSFTSRGSFISVSFENDEAHWVNPGETYSNALKRDSDAAPSSGQLASFPVGTITVELDCSL